MRGLAIGGIVLLIVTAAVAQGPQATSTQTIKTFASSADVKAMVEKAKKERKPDEPTYSQSILQLAPYRVRLEYRALVDKASVHEAEAEIYYVIDGSASLVTGGKLRDEKRTDQKNLAGSGIDGGTIQKMSKGDFAIVPENTPHWFSQIDDAVVLMTVHVPRPVPEGRKAE